jgi:zinc/manganese transport system permease protein
MFAQPFMQHALLAGTAVALIAGLVGYFVVLRAAVFTADALSHVAFTGALAALAAGVDLRLGLFILTVAVAVGMGVLGNRGRPDETVIGGVFAWILGLGVLCLRLYTSSGNGGAGSVSVLFGSIFGLTGPRAIQTAAIAGAACIVLLLIARPLLYASIDEAVAAARGVPVRVLGLGFLALVGVATAEATQVVGALQILGLIAAPAGAAMRLTNRPMRGLALSAGIAVVSMWIGLVLSFRIPSLPPTFAIIAVATLIFAMSALWSRLRSGQ